MDPKKRPGPANGVPGEHILVCLDEQPAGADLVNYAARLADALQAEFIALHVESTRDAGVREDGQDALAGNLRLAESLGGTTATCPGEDVAAEILAFALAHGIRQIVVGHPRSRRRFGLFFPSVPRTLMRDGKGLIVHSVPLERSDRRSRSLRKRLAGPLNPVPYLASLGLAAAVTVVCQESRHAIEISSVGVVYLTAIMVSAIAFGLGPSLLLSVISILIYDYLFLPPYYSLELDTTRDILTFILFIFTAAIVSGLASRTRAQMMLARNRSEITAELYQFSRRLAGVATLSDLVRAVTAQAVTMLCAEAVLLLPVGDKLVSQPCDGISLEFGAAEYGAAADVWKSGRPAGKDADLPQNGEWTFYPLGTPRGTLGVLAIRRNGASPVLMPQERRLVATLVDLTGVGLDRISLTAEIDSARLSSETERLRSALLTSISHDFRTPLTSILGILTTLRSFHRDYDAETRNELLATAQQEAERLNRFINNLLDITKISYGEIRANEEPVDIGETVDSALRRAKGVLGTHRVSVTIDDDLPLVRLDPILMEQTVFNILDNAAKYAPPGSNIAIRVAASELGIATEISDEGPGIPEKDLQRIFDKFYRVQEGDRPSGGTGLGLAICRAFVQAQGGQIAARNRTDRSGAIFVITIPADRAVPMDPEDPRAPQAPN
jgi:two-component system sensor histidine kinase KdpD